MQNPICFFDSGIGGATILREVIKVLPNENYIYYADSINNPYGNKSKDELFKIVDNIVNKLLVYNPKLIICACNTATSMVLNDIRKKYPDITFVGTEPAIKVVHDYYKNEKSIVITTRGTGESERFKELFKTYKTIDCKLIEAPDLAELIENNNDTYDYLKKILKNNLDAEVVVLGCTHFPLAIKNLKRILPNATFIDGSKGISKRVKVLLNNNLNDKKGSIKVISSKNDVTDKVLSIIKDLTF